MGRKKHPPPTAAVPRPLFQLLIQHVQSSIFRKTYTLLIGLVGQQHSGSDNSDSEPHRRFFSKVLKITGSSIYSEKFEFKCYGLRRKTSRAYFAVAENSGPELCHKSAKSVRDFGGGGELRKIWGVLCVRHCTHAIHRKKQLTIMQPMNDGPETVKERMLHGFPGTYALLAFVLKTPFYVLLHGPM